MKSWLVGDLTGHDKLSHAESASAGRNSVPHCCYSPGRRKPWWRSSSLSTLDRMRNAPGRAASNCSMNSSRVSGSASKRLCAASDRECTHMVTMKSAVRLPASRGPANLPAAAKARAAHRPCRWETCAGPPHARANIRAHFPLSIATPEANRVVAGKSRTQHR
jgi:hypothetical protein